MKNNQEIHQLRKENALLKKQMDRLYCEMGKLHMIKDLQEQLLQVATKEIQELRNTSPYSLHAIKSTPN